VPRAGYPAALLLSDVCIIQTPARHVRLGRVPHLSRHPLDNRPHWRGREALDGDGRGTGRTYAGRGYDNLNASHASTSSATSTAERAHRRAVRLRDANTMNYEATITDPTVFTVLDASYPERRMPDDEFWVCVSRGQPGSGRPRGPDSETVTKTAKTRRARRTAATRSAGPRRARRHQSRQHLLAGRNATGALQASPSISHASSDGGSTWQSISSVSIGRTDGGRGEGRRVDVALLAADPARAHDISFTAPYLEIEATYLVRRVGDRARLRTSIVRACGSRSRTRAHTTSRCGGRLLAPRSYVRRRPGVGELFFAEQLDALAGLRRCS